MRWKYFILGAFFLVTACYSSSKLSGDGSATDTRPDPTPHDTYDVPETVPPDIIADVAVDVAIDVGPDIPPPQCVTDSDCVAALHEDRCCHVCPQVMSRSEMAEDPCYHELGTSFPFPVPSPGCMFDCYACTGCPEYPPVYMARCMGGECVPVHDACDFPDITIPIPFLPATAFFDPAQYAPYVGQLISTSGFFYPGPDSCACCFDCFCDCYDQPMQPTLDCALVLRGSICDDEFQCFGTECEGRCTPIDGWGTVGATGFLVAYEGSYPELWVIEWGMYYDE